MEEGFTVEVVQHFINGSWYLKKLSLCKKSFKCLYSLVWYRTLTLSLRVGTLDRSTVIVTIVVRGSGLHTVGVSDGGILRKAIVCAVELHGRDIIIALDASSLLQSLANLGADHAEDGDLSLENLLVFADFHLSGLIEVSIRSRSTCGCRVSTYDIVDEAFPGTIIKDLLPKGSRSVEVLGSNLGQECDGLASELAMSLVKIDSALTELDGVDRAQIVGASALVVVCH